MIKSKGFTLVELMIVVVIVGILSTIALAQYNQYIYRAQASEVYAAEMVAKNIMEREALANNGLYPTSVVDTNSSRYKSDIKTLSYLNHIQCVSTNNQTSYNCAILSDLASSKINPKIKGLNYSFNKEGTLITTSGTGNSGWPTSSSCYVMSSSGCSK